MTKYLIYLASGNGSRFGSNKLLTPVKGIPLFEYGLRALKKAQDQVRDARILVVSRYPEIREAADLQGLQAVDCPDSVLGVSYTIRAGIRAIPRLQEEDYLLFLVADQPGIQASSLVSLLRQADGKIPLARLSWQGRPGNPVLFSARFKEALLSLQGDQGGGVIARGQPCILVPASQASELWDLDTPEDLPLLT